MNKIIEFFERPQVGKMVKYTFYGSLVFLLIVEFFIEKHPYFSFAALPAFYAVYGFISCALIIAVSKILGKVWLQKGEDYYE